MMFSRNPVGMTRLRTATGQRPRADTSRPCAVAHSRIAAVSSRGRPARADIRSRAATTGPPPRRLATTAGVRHCAM